MKALIDDLLDLARIEAQRFALHLQSVESRDLVEEALLAASPLAEAKRITLAAELIDSPRLEADPERIFRVLSNLLGNAIKFTPEGGTITVRAERRGDELSITVADTGPGIAADQLPACLRALLEGPADEPGRSGAGPLHRQRNRRGPRRTDLGRVLGRRRQVHLHSAPRTLSRAARGPPRGENGPQDAPWRFRCRRPRSPRSRPPPPRRSPSASHRLLRCYTLPPLHDFPAMSPRRRFRRKPPIPRPKPLSSA